MSQSNTSIVGSELPMNGRFGVIASGFNGSHLSFENSLMRDVRAELAHEDTHVLDAAPASAHPGSDPVAATCVPCSIASCIAPCLRSALSSTASPLYAIEFFNTLF
jgi:hypothetical protein